jgi:hypothetical protein
MIRALICTNLASLALSSRTSLLVMSSDMVGARKVGEANVTLVGDGELMVKGDAIALGKDRLGTNLKARYMKLPDDMSDVTVAAIEGLAEFNFNGDIGQQLVALGVSIGVAAISAVNPVLGAVAGIFASFFGGGGDENLMADIMERVDTMIKGSLASFANHLRHSHIQATLESIKYASEEVHWQIIAHDFLTGAPSMMNQSCWAISSPNSPALVFPSGGRALYDECMAYQNSDSFGTALKYELEYSALLLSSVAEMLRFKSHALDCRVVSLMNTLKQVRNLLKFHHGGAWGRKRLAGKNKKVSRGSAEPYGHMCNVKAVWDEKLKMSITSKHYSECLDTRKYYGGCDEYKKRLHLCATWYRTRISDQYEIIVKQINATELTIIKLEQKTSRVNGCGI